MKVGEIYPDLFGGKIEIINKVEKKYDVLFHKNNKIINGVESHTIKNKMPVQSKIIYRTGETNINCQGIKMTIIKYENSRNSTIQFDDNQQTIINNVMYSSFKKGEVRDYNYPSIYNKGYFGYGKYNYNENKLAYRHWFNMLNRCYNYKYHEMRPKYEQSEVCDEWLNFQNFAEWFYKYYYSIDNEIMCLDKDIINHGNKIYSPENCCFVSKAINSCFTKRDSARGEYPIGVTKEHDKYFKVSMSKFGELIHYKEVFQNEIEAFNFYKNQKEKYIKEIAELYKDKFKDKRIYPALYNYEVLITD